MKLTYKYHDLRLRHTFTIARSSRDIEPCIIVELEHEGIVGYGEAAPSDRYGETLHTVEDFLSTISLARFDDPFGLEEILVYVDGIAAGQTSAKAAVDLALHD